MSAMIYLERKGADLVLRVSAYRCLDIVRELAIVVGPKVHIVLLSELGDDRWEVQ